MKKLLAILALCTISCKPAVLETPDTETAAPVDDRAWVTWEECGHNIDENPCNFILTDQNGDEVELYDYHGKVIVIDFSTMWCSVCVNIAPKGDEFVQRYGEDNFIWLTVLIDNNVGDPPTLQDLQAWAAMANIKIPVLGGDRSLVDPTASTGYPITGWPTLVVIDQEMVLRRGISGWSEQAITTWVEELL